MSHGGPPWSKGSATREEAPAGWSPTGALLAPEVDDAQAYGLGDAGALGNTSEWKRTVERKALSRGA
jgi:hypothetical protein